MTNDVTLESDETLDPFRPPAWPYAVGAFGGAVFAVASLLLLCGVLAPRKIDASLGRLVLGGLAVGGGCLGVAWLRLMRRGPGGLGPAIGSLAIPAAAVFLYIYRNDWAHAKTKAAVVLIAWGAFALGHVFTRGLAVTRVCAIVALTAMFAEIVTGGRSAYDGLIAIGLFGGMAMVGFTVALGLPGLRRSPAST